MTLHPELRLDLNSLPAKLMRSTYCWKPKLRLDLNSLPAKLTLWLNYGDC